MKQVYLYFNEIKLGYLSENNGAYIWTPLSDGMSAFYEKYPLATDFLFLKADKVETYSKIPYHFNEFVIASRRPDLYKSAKINNSDSDFEKLYKMASLSFHEDDFYIKL